MHIDIPKSVTAVLDGLQNSGFEAYPVGGCVRDSVTGREPKDWDVCTNALPEQVKAALFGYACVDTGIKHGTVRIMTCKEGVEVTTFRIDGEYADSRHPEKVTFTSNLIHDLARRDFTVNAMAYDRKRGIIDPFGGREDIEKRIIRCVGEPDTRFSEDALRILRALRFASQLGFTIDEGTLEAMKRRCALLQKISQERISAELCLLLTGENVRYALSAAMETGAMREILPEFMPAVGFSQHNPHHDKTVGEHIITAVSNSAAELEVRLAMLLHDIGKPYCFTMDEKGTGHFYGHASQSEKMAQDILSRLRLPTSMIREVCLLIKLHGDSLVQTRTYANRLLNKLGEKTALRLMKVKRADALSKAPEHIAGSINSIDAFEKLLHSVIEENSCFSLKNLAVNGGDLIARGHKPGPRMGRVLDMLLCAVMDGKVPNEREALLKYAKKIETALE